MATRKAIEHRVHDVIDTMGTACPFKIANKMHIPIVYTELPKQIRGYMLHIDKRCCIVVSDSIITGKHPWWLLTRWVTTSYTISSSICFTITAVNTDVQGVNMKPTYSLFTCCHINSYS